MRDKLRAPVRGNMAWDSMLGKDMENEQLCQLNRCDSVDRWDEDALFGESVHNYQDCCESVGRRELLDEVH